MGNCSRYNTLQIKNKKKYKMGFSKYAIEKKQVSLDMGVTWQDATPSETRNGRLLGTYMTLVECENAGCDLQKLGVKFIDEKIPSIICTHANSTAVGSTSYDTYLPSGIAKSVTFVSGMKYCGDTWGSSDNIITDEYNNSSITAKTATITTDSNPIREYNSYVLDGREMISGSFCGEATCYNITEFMPWIDTNGTVKMAYTVRYVREHCSDEWKIDEEYTPQFITFGERWVKTNDGIKKATWQHQIATDVVSDDSELGWKVVWENEGEAFDYEYDVTVPQDVEQIEYLIADGVAASSSLWLDSYKMKVKIDPTNLGIPSGYLADKGACYTNIQGSWKILNKEIEGVTSYYVESKYIESTDAPPTYGDLVELTPNEWKIINIYGAYKAKYSALFGKLKLDYICEPRLMVGDGYTLNNAYVGGLIKIDGHMYFPYKVPSNLGWEDEYLNASEYGFIDREGDKIPLEYVYGKYTNTNGVTQSLKCNASTTLKAPSDAVDVVFANHVTSLPIGVCSDNTVLTSVTMNNVISIGGGAFSGCTSLSGVNIPSTVTEIGEAAFRGCTSFTSIDIPSGVTEIGDSAFSGCTALKSIDIPSTVTKIGNSAFVKCMLSPSIDIPSSVTEIGSGAFADCSDLEIVNMYSIHPPIVGTRFFTKSTITIPQEADLEEWQRNDYWLSYADRIIKRESKEITFIYRNSSHKGFISDLGVTLKDDTKIKIKLKPTNNGGGMIIGEVNAPSDDDDYRVFWYDCNYGSDISYDYGSDRKISGLHINNDYVFEVGNYYIKDLTDGRYIIKGKAKSGVATAHTRTLGLFGEENDDAWIYYIKVYEGDTLVKDFIPAKLEDGSGTLYDTLSKTYCSVSNGKLGIYTV